MYIYIEGGEMRVRQHVESLALALALALCLPLSLARYPPATLAVELFYSKTRACSQRGWLMQSLAGIKLR